MVMDAVGVVGNVMTRFHWMGRRTVWRGEDKVFRVRGGWYGCGWTRHCCCLVDGELFREEVAWVTNMEVFHKSNLAEKSEKLSLFRHHSYSSQTEHMYDLLFLNLSHGIIRSYATQIQTPCYESDTTAMRLCTIVIY